MARCLKISPCHRENSRLPFLRFNAKNSLNRQNHVSVTDGILRRATPYVWECGEKKRICVRDREKMLVERVTEGRNKTSRSRPDVVSPLLARSSFTPVHVGVYPRLPWYASEQRLKREDHHRVCNCRTRRVGTKRLWRLALFDSASLPFAVKEKHVCLTTSE